MERTDADPVDVAARLASLGTLHEPTRRALYLYVAEQAEPVSRDEAAAAVGVSRNVAAFHLDKLHEEGLLEVEYRRLTGRSGPGAGRTSKLYRRAAGEMAVSLPPRQYSLAAELLADALDDPSAGAARRRLRDVARARGRALAQRLAAPLAARAGRRRRLRALEELLAACGYEPYAEQAELRVRNCPFHQIAEKHVELVCGMNRDLVTGAAEQLGLDEIDVRLDPKPGECCIVIPLAAATGKSPSKRSKP